MAEKHGKYKEFLDSFNEEDATFENDRYAGLGTGEFWTKVEAYDHNHPVEVVVSSDSDEAPPPAKKPKKAARVAQEKHDKVGYKVAKQTRKKELGLSGKKRSRAGSSKDAELDSSDLDK